MVYSEEQQAILNSSAGFNMVVANAGVGKTEISAEFIVRSYLAEEKKLLPNGGHLTGEAQIKLLRQFKVISFTVKAASELTIRVYRKFKALGIPVPEQFGKEVPISRTCDAFIQRWLAHPLLMTLWLKVWPERLARLNELLGLIPARIRTSFADPSPRGEFVQERALFRAWGPLMSDSLRSSLVLVACSRHALMPGWQTLERQVEDAIKSTVANIQPLKAQEKILMQLEPKIVDLVELFFRSWRDKEKSLETVKRSLEQEAKLEAEIRPWVVARTLALEFEGIYDIARSVGYHPIHCKEALANRTLLNKMAEFEHLKSFKLLQLIAQDFERLKLRVFGMDFGDYMQAVKTTFEKNQFLLEKKKEYPSYGFRSKYLIWDEAQDNSLWQYWLLNLLCGAQGSGFHCLVLGDPKQAIYGFRGGNAEEFVRNIKFLKTHASNHLYGLTTSYRSCKKIIALGNEIARLLPANKVEAMDSKGVFVEEGDIVIAPPMLTPLEEFAYVKKEYDEIRRKCGKSSSIMLLARSNLHTHPAFAWVEAKKDPNLVIMTHHRSKGLEADHVFLLGMTAGRTPDPRSPMTDEVNLFYVACTRARMALHLCCPQVLVGDDGSEKLTGVSPFISLIPSLKQLALKSKYSLEKLKVGEQAHKALVGAFLSKKKGRLNFLQEELKVLFPEIPEGHYLKRHSMDTGARWKRHFKDPDKMNVKPKPFLQ